MISRGDKREVSLLYFLFIQSSPAGGANWP